MRFFSILFCVISLFYSASASAQLSSYQVSGQTIYTDLIGTPLEFFPQEIVVPKFDSSLGTLQRVTCTLTVGLTTSITFGNGAPDPVTVNVQLSGTVSTNGLPLCNVSIFSVDTVTVPGRAPDALGEITQTFSASNTEDVDSAGSSIYNATPESPDFIKIPQGRVSYFVDAPVNSGPNSSQTVVNLTLTYEYEPVVRCNVADSGRQVPFYSQGQAPWGQDPYAKLNGDEGEKMIDLGCATTSAAMLLNSYGISTDTEGQALTPGELNSGLRNFTFNNNGVNQSGYSGGSNLNWVSLAQYGRASFTETCVRGGGNRSTCQQQSLSSVSFKRLVDKNLNLQDVEDEICNGNPVILRVPSQQNDRDHFVLATGVENQGGQRIFTINDPGRTDGQNQTINQGILRGYRILRPQRDPNMIVVSASRNLDVLLVDSSGNRTGFSHASGDIEQIPDAVVTRVQIGSENPLQPEAEGELETLIYHFQNVAVGNYRVEATAIEAGPYNIEVNSYDLDGNINDRIVDEGILTLGEDRVINFNHSSDPLPPVEPPIVNNAKLRAKAFVLKGWRMRSDHLFIRGRLKADKPSQRKIEFSGSIEIGVGDKVVKFDESEIIPMGKRRKTVYLKKNGVRLYVDSRGKYVATVKNNGLFANAKSGSIRVFLKIDSLRGEKDLEFRCKKHYCRGH